MIETVAETGSTNSDLLERLRNGEAVSEGRWLVADRQVAGHGRMGREWFDGAGNFMGSTVVWPGPADPPAATLALVAGLALHDAIAKFVPPDATLLLKWPNDVLAKGAKLAGILLEGEGNGVVVGIGVNLAVAPDLTDRPAISLAALDTPVDRDSFARLLADHFAQELSRWRTLGMAQLLRRWRAAAHQPGTALSVTTADGTTLTGRFAGLDDDGCLQLTLADGTARVVTAGDVQLVADPA